MKTRLFFLIVNLLICITSSNAQNPTIFVYDFINDSVSNPDKDTVNDLHIMFKYTNANPSGSANTNTFPNYWNDPGKAGRSYNFYGKKVGPGNIASAGFSKFNESNEPLLIDYWFWTHDSITCGNHYPTSHKFQYVWYLIDILSTGNGSVEISINNRIDTFYTQANKTPAQTITLFNEFVGTFTESDTAMIYTYQIDTELWINWYCIY